MVKNYFKQLFLHQTFAVKKGSWDIASYNLGDKWLSMYRLNCTLVRLGMSNQILTGACDKCTEEDERYEYVVMEEIEYRPIEEDELKTIKKITPDQ